MHFSDEIKWSVAGGKSQGIYVSALGANVLVKNLSSNEVLVKSLGDHGKNQSHPVEPMSSIVVGGSAIEIEAVGGDATGTFSVHYGG